MSHIPEDTKVAKMLFAAIAEFEREFPTAPKPTPHGDGALVGWRSKVFDFDVYFFPKRTKMSTHDGDILVAIEISNSDKTAKGIHKVFGVAGKDDPDRLVSLFTMIRIFVEESSPWR